ncbi:MAG: SET domain-containing protein-lysine N-methyltransferase [Chitinophagaceae bacterium]|nr:SET domain-containing protein-lysine N-methyltransferase [Chitinophagaceae bacterium]
MHTATGVINQEYTIVSEHTVAAVWLNNNNHHHSLHAMQRFAPGDTIATFKAASIFSNPTYLTIQTGLNRHITLSPAYLQYTNHSCDPNVFFDTTAMQLICLQPIKPGDEMRFFYPSTEWEMSQPFICNCGSANCLQLINGAAGLSDATLSKYRLTDFIIQQLQQA